MTLVHSYVRRVTGFGPQRTRGAMLSDDYGSLLHPAFMTEIFNN